VPEGDILRRTAQRLDQALTGRVIIRADLRWPDVATVDLVGLTVQGTVSYGKHLLTRFDDGRTLHTHLRMDGSWGVARTGSPEAAGRGPVVRAVLANDLWTAIGHRLGMMDVVATRDEGLLLGHLGPDILAEEFEPAGLARALVSLESRGSVPVCEALLDQGVIAGIGTIYAAESLFARRVWPWTRVRDVDDPAALLLTARHLMQGSVERPWSGRTEATGLPKVHGRLREPCRRCGAPIAVGQARRPPMQRPIFYCPRCQAER
jgi:endonuclease-8